MPSPVLFAISNILAFVVWATVARLYIWPALKDRAPADALKPILVLHAFRYLGLAFVIPGVVSPELPAEFARPVAFGDLASAILALLALAALRTSAGRALAWIFNVVGTADLLFAFYLGTRIGLAETQGLLGAAYFILTAFVPVLLITHAMGFAILRRAKSAVPAPRVLRTA